jgi:hypothetical protein
MKHKRATDYGGRSPRGFWIESAFIALVALAFIAALLAMVAYAHAQPVSSTDIRVVDLRLELSRKPSARCHRGSSFSSLNPP